MPVRVDVEAPGPPPAQPVPKVSFRPVGRGKGKRETPDTIWVRRAQRLRAAAGWSRIKTERAIGASIFSPRPTIRAVLRLKEAEKEWAGELAAVDRGEIQVIQGRRYDWRERTERAEDLSDLGQVGLDGTALPGVGRGG